MINNLPANTVERLSLYRRALLNLPKEEKEYIHSHQLAHLLKINPAHVRRDLMLIGFTGDIHKGYEISKLIDSIGKAIDCLYDQKVAFVGIGDLGRAVADYFNNTQTKLKVAATFRLGDEPETQFPDVKCYNVAKMKDILRKENIELCVLAVPSEMAQEISSMLIFAGIKGILNFTSVYLKVPDNVYIEHYDMINKLEKLAYFTNKDRCGQ
ncbi:MAG: redox-sensing transcriptional repressor Rex [Bacteroidales bacterium]|nr:redox-sensing transcriptional repressor Rex [Bacteroidales bacterium]